MRSLERLLLGRRKEKQKYIQVGDRTMWIGKHEFVIGARPYVMGILNATPDSFSDGGRYNSLDRALYHVEEMIKDGADIIDIGGESTRPGYTLVSDEEEISRVCPVIEAVKQRFDIAVTLDTYKGAVAEAGIQSGVDMLNDIWGFRWDEEASVAKVAAKYNVGAVVMHNRKNTEYTSFVEDVVADLQDSLRIARDCGVDMEKIILDPGIGFAKDLQQNLSMMKHLEVLTELGYPVLLGTSRKSMIGLTLDLPKEEREEGTVATSVLGLVKGCSFFRVHDVKKNRRALDMTFAMLQAE
jgi:dihydropteroate synthase